ncbi:MAG TPA: C45 family peptidase [Parafilimonas sp.]|nr:C45 family peptidase [Parafilimonas sp.]
MLKTNRFVRRVLRVVGAICLLLFLLAVYLIWVSNIQPPKIKDTSAEQLQRTQHDSSFYTLKNNWLRKSKSGLYEMYIEGNPFERGVINGKLSRELVVSQEDYFAEKLNQMVPSSFYQHFLKYLIGWFNRNLPDHITKEYKQEIYGVSQSASDKYDYIGTNYQRLLNYHAAHDIGHALQNMALVGCTSFGTWGAMSEDSTMIIGRNFDFYVNDDFAKNKIILFCNPSQGHKFMSVNWGGFIGVVSGMNDKGLSVTINADKSKIPTASATPVSLVAREILQYAENINQALAIARKRKMFVSESFLIGSAEDKKAVIIEKTPDTIAVYDPQRNYILCANHFQSKELENSEANIVQKNENASPYRYQRLSQLMQQNGENTVAKTISILRDHEGLDNKNIGLGNEKTLNQFVAHHTIVFEPEKLKVWVSTSPWALGEFVCYDLNKVFSLKGLTKDEEIYDSASTIPADNFLQTPEFKNFERYRQYTHLLSDGKEINTDSMIAANPDYYHAYVLAGDYWYNKEEWQKALGYYQEALTKVIATKPEEDHIKKQIEVCHKKLPS